MKSIFSLFLLCVVFQSTLSNANSELPLPKGDSSYQPEWKIKKNIKQAWQLQQDATLPIAFEDGLQCTAVFVGPNGEALTNLHCLEDCLNRSALLPSFGRRVTVPEGLKVSCAIRYPKKYTHAPVEVLKVFGPGWLKDRTTLEAFYLEQPAEYLELLNQGYESHGDLVLIRLATEKSACVKIAEGSSLDIEPVLNISYPIVFRKTSNPMDPLTSLGLTQMWSHGELTSSITTIKQIAEQNDFIKDLAPTMAIERMTLSSVDAESGGSGSPIYNLSGEVVSILRSTFKGYNSEYASWTTQGIDLAPLKTQIESLVPGTSECGNK